MCTSKHSDLAALERHCTNFNFEPMCFDTADSEGRTIYHANVLISIAAEFALVCLDLIVGAIRRGEIRRRLNETGQTVIALAPSQIANFAGNALGLSGRNGRVLALSRRAFDCITPDQRRLIERSAQLSGIHLSSRRG